MAEEETPKTSGSGYGSNIFSLRNIIIYLILAVLIYGAIYFLFKKSYNKPVVTAPASEVPVATQSAANQLVVTLKAENNSGEDGIAILSEEDGKVKVLVTLASAVKDPQPAHIHEGACPDVGAIKWPLTNVVNGSSETTIDATMADVTAAGPLAINVHKSALDAKTYVSCGEVK